MTKVKNLDIGLVRNNAKHKVGFYLADSFNSLPMVAALEPLRIANRVSKDKLFQWSFITDDGEAVKASNDILHDADYSIDSPPEIDILVVIGPFFISDITNDKLINWVQEQHKQSKTIIGLESGCHVLALAGLLEGKKCTTHWEHREEYKSYWPEHDVSNDIYEMEDNIFTCSGGAAPLDMMLYLIEQIYEHELAASVADCMIHPHIRNSGEPQKMDIAFRTGINHPIVLECIQLIESNIEQPLTPDELANLFEISKRQLERLFLRYLKTSPARYYLTARLEKGRLLLEGSNMLITDIAKATGFRSVAHFSARYHSSYGIAPKDARENAIGKNPS